jgi:hypothetical protein
MVQSNRLEELGYRSLVLDMFDSGTRKHSASVDQNVRDASIAAIEDVDPVGSPTCIGELVRVCTWARVL